MILTDRDLDECMLRALQEQYDDATLSDKMRNDALNLRLYLTMARGCFPGCLVPKGRDEQTRHRKRISPVPKNSSSTVVIESRT